MSQNRIFTLVIMKKYMALIEGFRIQNYRALKDVAMRRIGTDSVLRSAKPPTPLTAALDCRSRNRA